MKKNIVLLFMFIASFSLFAMGGKEDTSKESTDEKVVTFWGGGWSQDESVWELFYEETGIRVEFGVSWPDEAALMAAIAAGNAPDAMFFNMQNVPDLAAKKALRSFEDYLGRSGNETELTDFYDFSLKLGMLEGKHYALPWDVEARLLYWNPALFEEAGLDPDTPPKTWAELLEFSKKLTKYNSAGELVQIGFEGNGDINTWLIQQDTYWYSEDGLTSTANNDKVATALQFALDLPKVYGDLEALPEGIEFGIRNGNVAMILDDAVWSYQDFVTNYQDLELKVAVPPSPEAGKTITHGWATWGIVLPKNSKNPELGAILASWMAEKGISADEIKKFDDDPSVYSGRPLAHIETSEYILNELLPTSPSSYVKEMYRKRNSILGSYVVYPPVSPVGAATQAHRDLYWNMVINGDMTIPGIMEAIDKIQEAAINEYLSSK